MQLMAGSYGSPRWTWEILDCSMPLTFDTYDNCSFQCVYCFSFFQRAVGDGKDDYLHHRVRAVNVEKVKALFRGEIPKSQFNWYIQRRMVMQWGGLSDGFDYYERKFRKSLELLRFFREIDYPISISTKGVWFLEDPEYMEAFAGARNVHVKSSIITLDTEKAHKIERGVATPEARFNMLYQLNKAGVGATTVRYRPFILGVSADYPFTEQSRQQIRAFVQRSADAGVYSLTTEFLCLESRASNTARERYAILAKISGVPQWDLYRAVSQSRAGLLRLNYDLKRPYIEAMQEECDRVGLKFFVSDAHHKEKSYGAGCCGLPSEGPLSNINRGQYAEAILIAKRNGQVRWRDIAAAAEPLKNIKFYAAEGFNQGGTDTRVRRMYQTMYDYMRDVWNNPKSMMSPNRYFGGALVASDPDEDGDIVYLYNEPFVADGVRTPSLAELKAQLAATGAAMGEDGADYGHVAYDVVVNAVGQLPHRMPLVLQLEHNRLNARLVVGRGTAPLWEAQLPSADIVEVGALNTTHAEAVELIRGDYALSGVERIWLLEPGATFTFDGKRQVTPRAYLSQREAEFAEAGEVDLPADIQLLQCARLTPEQRGAVM